MAAPSLIAIRLKSDSMLFTPGRGACSLILPQSRGRPGTTMTVTRYSAYTAGMKPSHALLRACLLLLVSLCCLPALAATVYKTVDENGVVSFSDTPPATDAPVETMKIDAPTPEVSADEQQRLQDMRETTDRMAADRKAREQQRAELRKEQSQPATPAPDYTDYMGYSGGNTGYYDRYPLRRPGYRPGLRPRPEQPIARPPVRPPVTRPARPRR